MYAFITGASSGLGREFSLQLARRGYDLIIVARRKDRLIKLKHYIEQRYHRNVIIYVADLSNEKNCYDLFKAIKKYPIRVVINNAGFGKAGEFCEIPLKQELNMIHTNVIALHIFTKLFAKHLKHGYILNVSSIAGYVPTPVMSTYGATKAYVLNFSKSIQYELSKKQKKVYISTLCPGPVSTEFNKVAGVSYDLKSISTKKCVKDGLNGLFHHKSVIIPGMQTRFLGFFSKFIPDPLLLYIEYRIQSKKLSS